MSKEKQIEEMAKVMCGGCADGKECMRCLCADWYRAENLYNAGYRKQGEGEWMPSDFLHEDEDEKDDWKNYTCSLCGYRTEAYYRDVRDIGYKFCPNCGAKMKGGADQ